MKGAKANSEQAAADAGPEQFIVLTGLSGSGKTTALNAFRDAGYYCVDSLPAPLLGSFVELIESGGKGRGLGERRFALLLDHWHAETLDKLKDALRRLEAYGVDVSLLFFDCQDDVIVRRFQETRRPHPVRLLDPSVEHLAEAIRRERCLLAPYRDLATRIIDTSAYSPHELRRTVESFIGHQRRPAVTVISFGFKYGVPQDVDLVFDVRFLPNPHFVPELKEHIGLDAGVRDYVFQSGDAEAFVQHLRNIFEFLLPRYRLEGKAALTIGIGCTGGRHRSVAVTERIAEVLRGFGEAVVTQHRDTQRHWS